MSVTSHYDHQRDVVITSSLHPMYILPIQTSSLRMLCHRGYLVIALDKFYYTHCIHVFHITGKRQTQQTQLPYGCNGGSRMGHLGQMPPPPPPPPPFKKLHTRSRYFNRAVNYSNKAVTMFMRQCSLLMKL